MEKEKKSGINTEHHVLIAVEAVAFWLCSLLVGVYFNESRKLKQTTITSFDKHDSETNHCLIKTSPPPTEMLCYGQ